MKKFSVFLILGWMLFLASSCDGRERLMLLNWGEYINDEVVALFEQEYNVVVVPAFVENNEGFYEKVDNATTLYDNVVPSDYMIEKMKQDDLLQKIDLTKLTNYDSINNPLMPGVLGIQGEMFAGNEEYAVPYFWGTWGLMYNKKVAGLEEAIQTHGWDAYFETSKVPAGTRVGMYNIPRYAYAAAMLYNGLSVNEESATALATANTTLRMRQFSEWGTDTLKKAIVANNLDLAFVWTGDFLDVYYSQLDTDPDTSKITFDIYIPEDTIAFMDGLAIPKNARNVELAHKFIDFMLRPEMAYLNASVVGYCTPVLKAYDQIVEYEGTDAWLNAWAEANLKYYPKPTIDDPVQFKGTPLSNLSRDFIAQINTMVNNVKVG
ncbi:MAG: extracellular solute-binding protein [Bacilli bacterium]|nr:extracellular solute-binding protein [Bacilli bacterium]